jgi:CheY-like chemotaxis protein
MPRGGILTIRTANVELDDGYVERRGEVAIKAGRYVMLAVADTGTGMTAEVQERIFEPFFTTKAADVGTGLGLATVYGIVKQSGGYIWTYSEPGLGTIFKVYLPQVDLAEEAGASRKRKSAVRLSGRETILVAEDDGALRYVACRALRTFGYLVLEARNGREALDLCERYDGPIHAVVSDLVMPEMSGSELADRIAARHPGIKVLLMSGYSGDEAARMSIMRAGDAFIEKPFAADALAARVRELLDG